MQFTFIRHAETDLNGKGYIATQLDYHINERGIYQCVNSVFEEKDFDAVYCSPSKRTKDTARLVYPYKEPIVSPLISQRNLGILNEKKKWECDKEYLKSVRAYIVNPENAETLNDLKRRIDMFFNLVREQQSDDNKILVVSHNGIMRIIKLYYMSEVEEVDTKNLGGFTYKLKR